MAKTVTNLPAMRETQVRSLGREDLLEEGKATHSSILAWRIPMDRGTWGGWGGHSSQGRKESDTTERLTFNINTDNRETVGDRAGQNSRVRKDFVIPGAQAGQRHFQRGGVQGKSWFPHLPPAPPSRETKGHRGNCCEGRDPTGLETNPSGGSLSKSQLGFPVKFSPQPPTPFSPSAAASRAPHGDEPKGTVL